MESAKSSLKRPGFGSSGKSLSFEDENPTPISPIVTEDPKPSAPPQNPNRYQNHRTGKWISDSYGEEDNSSGDDLPRNGRGCAWWEPDNERNLAEFCLQTSIHGLKYLGEPKRHICERFFWFCSFTLSVLAAGYLINSVWLKYTESPVVVTFQPFETFIEQIPFPAVTICNMNKVLKSKAKEYMKDAVGPENDILAAQARKNVYYLDHVCSTSNKPFSKIFNYSSTQGAVDPEILRLATEKIKPGDGGVEDVQEFLQNVTLFASFYTEFKGNGSIIASQTCTDMLKLCLWQGKIYNCSELFRPIETNFGKCCTFNMVPQTLLHRYRNDSRDTAKLIERWNEWDLEKDGIITPGDNRDKKKYPRRQMRAGKVSGLAFLADPALDEYFCTSSDSTGFRLATHLSTDVPHVTDFGLAIRPNSEHFINVRPEITLADDIIREYSTNKRNCYFEGDYVLNYYNYYTSWNCFDECIANLTYERCNCVRYYMPRDDKREICGPANFTCAEDVKTMSFQSGVKNLCQYCLPSCTEIKYSAEATATPFRRRVDLWVDDFNVSTSWAKSNISIIHVYFGQDSTYARVRGQLYGITDLIANFGGLMGLCMGFSGLSLIELIYFFTMRVWCRRKRKRLVKKQSRNRMRRSAPKTRLASPISQGFNSYEYGKPNPAFELEASTGNGENKNCKTEKDFPEFSISRL